MLRLGLRQMGALLALLCASVVVLAGCGGGSKHSSKTRASTASSSVSSTASSTAAPAGAGNAAPAHTVRWHKCPPGQCGTLQVPLSYVDPGGRQIKLALFRLPATDPAKRIGAVLLNPGGPGSSGVSFAKLSGFGLPDRLRARFDIVSWDPRGTGASDPIDCGAAQARALTVDTAPIIAAQRNALAAGDRRFGAACKAKLGPILGNVATVDTARDMDAIRAALGDQRVTYIGYSYGTYLGAVYANMFPTHVRAMVLDGVEDPGQGFTTTLLVQARALDVAIDAFLRKCAAQRSCPFYSDGHPGRAFDTLIHRLETHPLTVGHRQLGPTQFFFGVANPLSSDDTNSVAKDLATAAHGNGAPLLASFDDYVKRKPNGTYSTEQSANTAINCLDGQTLGKLPAALALQHQFTSAAPRFGRFVLYSNLTCGYWPEPPRPPKLPITAVGAPPIVVIGSTGDPVTPYRDAVHLAHELRSGVLLTSNNTGHTSNFGLGGPCDTLGINYLLTTKPPPHGSHCAPATH